jgi:hypothetical protein
MQGMRGLVDQGGQAHTLKNRGYADWAEGMHEVVAKCRIRSETTRMRIWKWLRLILLAAACYSSIYYFSRKEYCTPVEKLALASPGIVGLVIIFVNWRKLVR